MILGSDIIISVQTHPSLEQTKSFFSEAFSLEGLHTEDKAQFGEDELQDLNEWIDLDALVAYPKIQCIEAKTKDGVVVGMAFLGIQHPISWPDGYKAELFIIGVLPQYQGLGLGSKILKAAEDTACRIKAHKLIVTTNADLTATLRFYERNGYKSIGTLNDYYDNGDAVVLGKVLV